MQNETVQGGNPLSKLNQAIAQYTQSVNQSPIFNPLLSNGVNNGNSAKNPMNQQPVNITMNITAPEGNSGRMSQGQMLADAATSILRANRRNL
jgi:hypothetical protein